MYRNFIHDTLPSQTAGIASYNLNGHKVWLKRAVKRNTRLAYLPLCVFAWWMKIDALRPVPNLGGKQSIRTEASRIKELGAVGVPVPTILAQTHNALLLSDAGSTNAPAVTLQEVLVNASTPDEVDHYLHIAVSELNKVHGKNCYLSESFARNILVSDDKICFIDFETDPGRVHSLNNCILRDWYCLLFSLYGKLARRPMQRERLLPNLQKGLNNASPSVQKSFEATLPKLQRLRYIPFHYFGRDGKKINATLQALKRLERKL